MNLLKRMMADLLLPESYILHVARVASYMYKTYAIPKVGGGVRVIHHPARELKALQRYLLRTAIGRWPVHDDAKAYRKNVGTKDNALLHRRSRYLLRLDFEDFFHSITAGDLRHYLDRNASLITDWEDSDKELFFRLVCRFDQLTIGAPTSPGLSNVVCYQLDRQLQGLAASKGLTYSRYADDLFFSTSEPDVLRGVPAAVVETLKRLSVPAALRLNEAKTRHLSKKKHRRVTGIVLTSDGDISPGRPLKRVIRAKIHQWNSLKAEERRKISGLLNYVSDIDPDFVNSLILKYGRTAVRKVQTAAAEPAPQT